MISRSVYAFTAMLVMKTTKQADSNV